MFTPEIVRFATDEELARLDFTQRTLVKERLQQSEALKALANRVLDLLYRNDIHRKIVLVYSKSDDAINIQGPLQSVLEVITGAQFSSQTLVDSQTSEWTQSSPVYIGLRE